ncbi:MULTISPECIES: DUF2789 family protein [unclassified Pseudomonas]|uniref:DUF2789 family protein n=1 Tax=unclassified Pseudomonas TaxID=196821 RepID=UPI000BD6E9AF|nr:MULTISPECIES: DUF2789 family protein [unclassified Pseudomonas]PVZ13489.1 uncharacterized protein DUF2789 [Pseudomonas sp. URIL14HWK12:I12]PVZ23795.1 uncharacterized protein DUF2789 [Pseudomonas sp. URIL14HWK12:I10]PVZ33566.1 uncharacterized protein DUF2789 [Pseudomonas sp. URIL14HWK12:I11]SNZ12040.1 Protein of unknown function [Pseudomonas sp. URIL14HWK12:I9]
MELENHTLSTLFQQLGLDNSASNIDAFIEKHQLPNDQKVSDADFWNEAQAALLKEAILADGPEALWVDELNVRLHSDANAA